MYYMVKMDYDSMGVFPQSEEHHTDERIPDGMVADDPIIQDWGIML